MDIKTDVPIILTEEYADNCAAAIVEVLAERAELVKKQDCCAVVVRGIDRRSKANDLAAEMVRRGYTATVEECACE